MQDARSHHSLIQGLLWAPLKPGQIWIFSSLCGRGAIWLLGLTLFSADVFIASLNLLRFLTVSFCDGRFSCSSDGALLCVTTRSDSSIACSYDPALPMMETVPSLLVVSCWSSQEHDWWFLLLVQPCENECPGRIHGLPCSTLADECLPLRSSGWY